MLLLDDDPQDQERARNERVRALAIGVPIVYGHAPVDTILYGYGEGRKPIMVGIEVKRARDLADSVVRSGRLVQQFRTAVEFGCERLYLIYQDIVRANPNDGLLDIHSAGRWRNCDPAVMYSRVDNFLNTLQDRGIIVKKTSDQAESAQVIVDLYNWWQKPPEEHDSLERFYSPANLISPTKIPVFRRIVKEFDGVGLQRSLDFMNTFADQGLSTRDVLNMEAKEWQKVRGIGPETTKKMEDALRKVITKRG